MKKTFCLVMIAFLGCAGNSEFRQGGEELTSADENATIEGELSAGVAIGSTLKTTAGLNLRTGAGTSYAVRLVIPEGATVVTVNTASPTNGFYNVKYNGVTGWSSGAYLTLVSSPSTGTSSTVRDAAIVRAAQGVGFSYWWGHGRYLSTGVTSSAKGSCTGNCPSCTHGGSYGADCSGFAAKVWQVPSTNTNVATDSHPYSTATFVGSNSQWTTIARDSALKGDALVYNVDGSGHIVIYESGDAWGNFWTYEARGCSYGIVHNLRSVTSAYKTIRRAGW